jgi:tetratricopeptide (TPR) repeat protein
MRCYGLLVLSGLLASCAVAPWDPNLLTCNGTTGALNEQLNVESRTFSAWALPTRSGVFLLNNCSAPDSSVEEQIAACTRAIGSGRLSNRELALALECRGTEWVRKGDMARAIADFSESIRLESYNAVAYSNRGLAWAVKGDSTRAVSDFDQAIRLEPKYAAAFSNRAATWYQIGETDRAIADGDRAVTINPHLGAPRINLGLAFSAKGDGVRAIEEFDWAVSRTRPPNASFYNFRGEEWVKRGDHDRAIADFSDAIRLDPRSATAYLNRAAAWRAKGQIDEANADTKEAMRLRAADPR